MTREIFVRPTIVVIIVLTILTFSLSSLNLADASVQMESHQYNSAVDSFEYDSIDGKIVNRGTSPLYKHDIIFEVFFYNHPLSDRMLEYSIWDNEAVQKQILRPGESSVFEILIEDDHIINEAAKYDIKINGVMVVKGALVPDWCTTEECMADFVK